MMVEDQAHIDKGQRNTSREQGFSAGGTTCARSVLMQHGLLGLCDGHVFGNDSIPEGFLPDPVELAL
jgi:hypothetical protein